MDVLSEVPTCDDRKDNEELLNTNNLTKARILKNLVVISLTFLFSGTATAGLNILQSTMNKEVGVVSVAIEYACGCIAALVLPKYLIKKFGSKIVIVISMFSYIPYLASNFYPVFGFMVPASILVGFASSLIFNAVSTFLNDLASLYSRLSLKNEYQNPIVESSYLEKEVLKNEQRDSSRFYNSIPNVKNGIAMSKQYSFEENDDNLNEDNIEKETSLKENECAPELNRGFSEELSEKSNLIEEDLKKHAKTNVLKSQSSSILKHTHNLNRYEPITEETPIASNSSITAIVENQNFKHFGTEGILESKIYTSRSVSRESQHPYSEHKFARKIIKGKNDSFLLDVPPSDKAIKVLETTTSRFFGFFGCVYQMCQVLCNIIPHLILKDNLKEREYMLNSSCMCGSEFCSMESACVMHNLQLPSVETRYTLTTVYILIGFFSALLTLLFIDNLNQINEKVSFSFEIAIMTFKFHMKKNQLLLVPLSLYSGMSQAFITGDFTKDFIGCALGVEHVPLVMLSAGSAVSLFSGLYALFEKHIGRHFSFFVAAALNLAVHITMLYWIPDSTEPTILFVIAFIWGAITGILWCQVRAFIGLIFKEEEETAFGCYQFWHAFGTAIVYAYNNFMCTYIKIYILLAVSTIAGIGYLLAERNYALSKKQNLKTP